MVYFLNVSKDSVLLVDSWTTYNDEVSIIATKQLNSNVKTYGFPSEDNRYYSTSR